MSNTPRRLHSVANALRLMEELADLPEGVGVSELSRRMGLGKSTVHLLLSTLVERGFAEKASEGVYRLGISAFEVGSAVPDSARFGGALAKPMRRLADASGEAVSLAVRRGSDAIFVQRFESASILRAEIRIGTRMPVHSCASGKILMSEMDRAEIDALFPSASLPFVTIHTLRKKSLLLRELEVVRREGYALNNEEYTEQVRGAAAGIRDGSGLLVAALSIAGPMGRFQPNQWVEALMDTADEMQQIMSSRSAGLT